MVGNGIESPVEGEMFDGYSLALSLSSSAWSTICYMLEQLPISCSSLHWRRRPELRPVLSHNQTHPLRYRLTPHPETLFQTFDQWDSPVPSTSSAIWATHSDSIWVGGEGAGRTVAGFSSPDTATGHRLLLLPVSQLAESRCTPPVNQTLMV